MLNAGSTVTAARDACVTAVLVVLRWAGHVPQSQCGETGLARQERTPRLTWRCVWQGQAYNDSRLDHIIILGGIVTDAFHLIDFNALILRSARARFRVRE